MPRIRCKINAHIDGDDIEYGRVREHDKQTSDNLRKRIERTSNQRERGDQRERTTTSATTYPNENPSEEEMMGVREREAMLCRVETPPGD